MVAVAVAAVVAAAAAAWNHLYERASRSNPRSPGRPRPPLAALQPGGRRKLLEFSKSDVQDIMSEGMASSRRWRREREREEEEKRK